MLDFSLLFILTSRLGLHYLLSAAIAYIAGITLNYFLTVFWAFSDIFHRRKVKHYGVEFLLHVVIGMTGLGLTELFMWIFTGLLGIFYLFSKLFTTVLVFIWNFSARRFLLYHPES